MNPVQKAHLENVRLQKSKCWVQKQIKNSNLPPSPKFFKDSKKISLCDKKLWTGVIMLINGFLRVPFIWPALRNRARFRLVLCFYT